MKVLSVMVWHGQACVIRRPVDQYQIVPSDLYSVGSQELCCVLEIPEDSVKKMSEY